jgi:nicotinate-nucleotide pyrophosphorylase (carboxylating)
MNRTREQRIEQALFRAGALTMENARYRETVRALGKILLQGDLARADLTAKALEIGKTPVQASILCQQGGIAAGLDEFSLLLGEQGIEVVPERRDGDQVSPGEVLARAEGPEGKLLGIERVGLNLLQRMSGVATAAHCFEQRARQCGRARVVGTRKTLWSLLDKRALHLGGAGTHRLGLGDAILIKNNHLRLFGTTEDDAVPSALERAWGARREAAFIEVEVRGQPAARAAAETFRRLQADASEEYPCLLLLDNLEPEQIKHAIGRLQDEQLWDHVLIEASGGITEGNLEAYATTGVDAISLGALTHSARALDICLRIS